MTESNTKTPPQSMVKLYGMDDAIIVNKICHEVDQFFGEFVAEFVYDTMWERPPLNYIEKSIVTITSLAVIDRMDQLKILAKIPLHLGKNIEFILYILIYLHHNKFIKSYDKILTILQSSLNKLNLIELMNQVKQTDLNNILSKKELAIIHLSALTTLGNREDIIKYYKEIISDKTLLVDEIGGVLRHQMIYCGCPCTMCGFAWLNEVVKS